MIGSAIAFLITPIGRWAGIAAILFTSWFAFAKHYENKGASRVSAQIEKKVEANAKKADGVRQRVQSIPSDKLLDIYTRD